KCAPIASPIMKSVTKKSKVNILFGNDDSYEEVDMLMENLLSISNEQLHPDHAVIPPYKRQCMQSNASESGFESGWTQSRSQLSNGQRTLQEMCKHSTLSSFSKSSSFKKPKLKLAKPR
ncbi:unnamed protein product, partial [Meganyctiphanes norvegica]